MWPNVMEKLLVAKDLLIYPLFKACVEDQILPVAVQYRKSQDCFDLMWRLQSLWLWCSDPVIYREWHEAFGNDAFEVMPDHLVEWYKGLKVEWDKLVEVSREARIQKIRDEVNFLENEIADPKWQSEPDYIRDCQKDMGDMMGLLREIEVLG